MHEVYIEILLSTIKEQFANEEDFYSSILGLDQGQWQEWQAGRSTLAPEQNQKIKNLFTDYEWMLVQKVMRQTIIFPEKRTTAVNDYRLMKTKIAQKWLKSKLADVEVVDAEGPQTRQMIDLKVTIAYEQWGFDDILTFRLPTMLQQQLQKEKVALLEWVNENLEETYIA